MKVQNICEKLVVLGTGGTIAGEAANALDNIGYVAAQRTAMHLLESLPGLAPILGQRQLVVEQVSQIDSKDMSFTVWQELVHRISHHLSQVAVKGIVITHGTDTLEETAYFLQSVLPPQLLANKPVVLTCAMRPASSLSPDGPQNLLDSISVVFSPGPCGVLAVCSGVIHGASDVYKTHTYRLDAFSSGEAGPLGFVEEGFVRWIKNGPRMFAASKHGCVETMTSRKIWPNVEIVMNYAGATGAIVDALVRAHQHGYASIQGLVVAGTGNGTIHCDLEAALLRAQALGIKIWLTSQCRSGWVLPLKSRCFPVAQGLSPVKARVALILELLLEQEIGEI